MTFPLNELIEATGQKKHILGKGGYGTVYKGNLRHTIVAVKFLNEVWHETRWLILSCVSILSLGGSVVSWMSKCGSYNARD